jgi:predicted dehydrogenase
MEAFLDLVSSGRINTERLIAAEFPLEKAPEAYDSLGTQNGVALLLSYPEAPFEERNEAAADLSPTKKAGTISVGLVGPGNFAKETIIPALRSSPDYHLKWVVSSNPLHATQAAKRYGFERSTTDLNEALGDPDLEAVIIASPNNLHYSMLAQAIKAGKTALVEKPLCITREELEELKKIHQDTRAPIMVGFNRRYAPLVLQMKSKMTKLDGPFVLTYRVNAGFVPVSKWSQDARLGGGRIIHECCHFFDLFNFLLEADNPTIQVATTSINNSSSVARDNLIVILKYPDGSLASLVYVSMGDKGMDRERIEVFGQGASMVLDDFKELHFYGEKPTSIRLPRADKGHSSEFGELAKFLRGLPSSIITSEEGFSAMDLTFRVDEAARKAP